MTDKPPNTQGLRRHPSSRVAGHMSVVMGYLHASSTDAPTWADIANADIDHHYLLHRADRDSLSHHHHSPDGSLLVHAHDIIHRDHEGWECPDVRLCYPHTHAYTPDDHTASAVYMDNLTGHVFREQRFGSSAHDHGSP